MKRLFSLFMATAAIGFAAAQADATLTTIGTVTYGTGTYNLIYDDTPGLIWMDYSNANNTWQNQIAWASNLNTAGVLTYNINPEWILSWSGDWRLPNANLSTPDYTYGYDGTTTAGYQIFSSEIGHLYYSELGNLGYYNAELAYQPGWGFNNSGPFENLQAELYYWFSTEYAPSTDLAWFYTIWDGHQDITSKVHMSLSAIAVRPGDVAAALPALPPDTASVPEPGTLMLLGSGLAGLAFWRRFRKG